MTETIDMSNQIANFIEQQKEFVDKVQTVLEDGIREYLKEHELEYPSCYIRPRRSK